MPNYCNNHLTIKSPTLGQSLEAILGPFLDEEGSLDFEKIAPTPKGLSPEQGQEWRVQNWGTKWSPEEITIDEDLGAVSFVTAWDPPDRLVVALAKRTQAVWQLEWAELGNAICGRLLADAEGIQEEQNWEPRKSPKAFREKMGIHEEDLWTPEEIAERREKTQRKKTQRKAKKAVQVLKSKRSGTKGEKEGEMLEI